MLEDIALMRAMPNMIVISPCDAEEARKATLAAARVGKPVYMRFGREKTPVMTTTETPFTIGKVNVLWRSDAPKVAIVATGSLVHHALLSARSLGEKGIGSVVVNVHTVKPLDPQLVEIARECGAVVTVEEHQKHGGMGSAVAELLATEAPTRMAFVSMQDRYGQSGTPSELIAHYKMDAAGITEVVTKLMH
jgi:transketolase